MMQVAKKIPFDDPMVLNAARVVYLLSNLIIVGLYLYVQLKSLWRTQLIGIAMMGVMHIYLKYTNPLLIQSILPLKSAIESNLVKIHVFGKPASGDLKRPFKAPANFLSGLQGGTVQSD